LKEVVVTQLEVIFEYLLGVTEGNHEHFKLMGFQPRFEPGTSRKHIRSFIIKAKFYRIVEVFKGVGLHIIDLNMEAVYYSEKLVPVYQTKRCPNPEVLNVKRYVFVEEQLSNRFQVLW
jgi:hypothetical protein